MLAHLYQFWRLYVSIAAMWMIQNYLPSALQGAASEAGQTVYGWLTHFNAVLDGLNFLKELGEKFG